MPSRVYEPLMGVDSHPMPQLGQYMPAPQPLRILKR